MKNQYYGDINDYKKYGLLRQLQRTFKYKIGVIWMLTPDTLENKDGNKIAYVSKPLEYRGYDPVLFDHLKKRVKGKERNVKYAEEDGILPSTKYYFNHVPVNNEERDDYMDEAGELIKECNLIFFDPDNGLEVNVKRGNKDSDKYLYYDELKSLHGDDKEYVTRNETQLRIADKLKDIAPKKEIVSFSTAHVAFIYLAKSKENVFKISRHLFEQWNDQFDLRILLA